MTMVSPGKADLVAWWALGEASGDRADSHTGGYTMTATGSPGSRSGKVGSAADITNSNWLSTAAPSSAFRMQSSNSLTTTAWFYLDNLAAGDAYIIGRWNSGDWAINFTNSGNIFLAMNTASGIQSATTPSSTITTGQWYHVAAWFDHATGSNGTGYIQINNGTIYTKALTAAKSSEVSTTTTIGKIAVFGGYGHTDGAIDEVNVFSRVLTADEREWLYNTGSGRTYSDLTAQSVVPHMGAGYHWWAL